MAPTRRCRRIRPCLPGAIPAAIDWATTERGDRSPSGSLSSALAPLPPAARLKAPLPANPPPVSSPPPASPLEAPLHPALRTFPRVAVASHRCILRRSIRQPRPRFFPRRFYRASPPPLAVPAGPVAPAGVGCNPGCISPAKAEGMSAAPDPAAAGAAVGSAAAPASPAAAAAARAAGFPPAVHREAHREGPQAVLQAAHRSP